MKPHFLLMARYNAWANARLYEMAGNLSDEQYRRDAGTYFKSLHQTLNHILVADRIWMRRLTGTGDHPTALNAVLHDDFASLRAARQAEDARIVAYVEALTDDAFEQDHAYSTLGGAQHRQPLREILAHLFNHQTHHRGQAHAILTAVGVAEPAGLDLIYYYREKR